MCDSIDEFTHTHPSCAYRHCRHDTRQSGINFPICHTCEVPRHHYCIVGFVTTQFQPGAKVTTPLNTLMGGAEILVTELLQYILCHAVRWPLAVGSLSDQLVPTPHTRGRVVGRYAVSSCFGCRSLCGYYPENYPIDYSHF